MFIVDASKKNYIQRTTLLVIVTIIEINKVFIKYLK